MGGHKQAVDETPFGNRTLNSALETVVRETPDRIYSWIPKTDNLKDGFRPMTFQELQNGASAAAHWLDQQFGKLPQDPSLRQAVAYVGPNDLRYLFLVLGADRSNRSVLIPFIGWNSSEALGRLVDSTKSVAVLAPPSHVHVWDPVKSDRPDLQSKVVPDLDFFHDGKSPYYAYDQDIKEFWNSALYIIHTSGTTGFPKPLFQTNASISAVDLYGAATAHNLPLEQQHGCLYDWKDRLTMNCMPFTWVLGIVVGLMAPLFCGTVPVAMPGWVPNPPPFEVIKQIRELMPDISNTVLIPSVIRDIWNSEGGPEFITSFDIMCYAGAPLDKAVGDAIVKRTRVQSLMGSTDAGAYDYYANPDMADWQWMHFRLDGKWKLEQFSDDLYELVLIKDPDRMQSCFLMYPDLDVFRTADLFARHPDPAKKHLWRPAGRADDFVRMQSMTKFNAIEVERAIDAHPEISRCIVDCGGRTAPFVILQPAFPGKYDTPADALNAMWPGIEKANEALLPEAKLTKRLAIVTSAEKPLGFTQKGTTERRKGVTAYADEIEELYKEV
ncbi:acetyl-CoA synthetase-like protein [Myriangium duriaei CBS 260.36]|uniref:Acetyl-CoA synthetase-like protein n=1 Tax=Myriangium duriaei CBS 260.36 TaxID=1168546 RepID=A0A9P4IWE3_9PEZI|nr:acetyl-CoA synthetase-like protein [Myriangium duriaei CBS 260.36]